MSDLQAQLEEALAEVDRLKRRILAAPCSEVGHRWELLGGKWCGCHEDAACGLPVYQCAVCGDCDYGENAEAADIRRHCSMEAQHG